jgi:hypothetical protein
MITKFRPIVVLLEQGEACPRWNVTVLSYQTPAWLEEMVESRNHVIQTPSLPPAAAVRIVHDGGGVEVGDWGAADAVGGGVAGRRAATGWQRATLST